MFVYFLLCLCLVGLGSSSFEDPFNEFQKSYQEYTERIEKYKFLKFQNQPQKLDEFNYNKLVTTVMECRSIPGIAVSIVKGDDILFKKALGFADKENSKPMTANTLIALGSCSKRFNALLLGTLKAEGKLDWDTPLPTYWSHFGSKYPFSETTIVDLSTHRLGITRNDYPWLLQAKTTMREVALGMKYYSPIYSFRTGFSYTNIGVATAGYIAADIILESNWFKEVKERVLDPIEMFNTKTSFKDGLATGKASKFYSSSGSPYHDDINTVGDTVAPAAAIMSNLNDITKFLFFLTSGGKNSKGEQVIPVDVLAYLNAPKGAFSYPPIDFDPSIFPFSFSLTSSAMGWFIGHYRGHLLYWHKGTVSGASATIAYLPNVNIAFSCLSNSNNAFSDFVLMFAAFDYALGIDTFLDTTTICSFPCPWHPSCQNASKAVPPHTEDLPSLINPNSFADYNGFYTNPGYGTINIATGDTLRLVWGNATCSLTHQNGDELRFKCKATPSPTPFPLRLFFQRTYGGHVSSLIASQIADGFDVPFTNHRHRLSFVTYPEIIPTQPTISRLT